MFDTIIPAYGRDYSSKKAVLADWLAGKDFQICNTMSPNDGRKVNRQDAEKGKVSGFNVRFAKLTKIAVLRFRDGTWKVS